MNVFGRFGLTNLFGKSGVSSINAAANSLQSIRFATKKAGGSSKNGRDSPGQRLGLKKFGGEHVTPGHIILRQRGQKYHHGENTYMSRDHTIHAKIEGYVKFKWNRIKKHQIVSVSLINPNIPPKDRSLPVEIVAEA